MFAKIVKIAKIATLAGDFLCSLAFQCSAIFAIFRRIRNFRKNRENRKNPSSCLGLLVFSCPSVFCDFWQISQFSHLRLNLDISRLRVTQIKRHPIVVHVVVPRCSITEDQIRSNDYLWVVALEKKGNLLKEMASNNHSESISRTSSVF